MSDLIEQVVTPAGLQFQNTAAEARGVDLELSYRAAGGLAARGSWSWQDATDAQGAWLDSSPRNLAKLNLSMPLVPGWVEAGFDMQYASRQKTPLGETGAAAVANLTLVASRPNQGWALSASVYNLFDKRLFDPAAADPALPLRDRFEQNGRNCPVKLTWAF